MKVSVTLKMEVNQDAWAEDQGVAVSAVERDVRSWLLNQVQQSVAAGDGLIKTVTVGGAK